MKDTHTHTHTHIYVYIYRQTDRQTKGYREKRKVNGCKRKNSIKERQ